MTVDKPTLVHRVGAVEEKHAIVLGCGSDIGRELSARLTRDGWWVSGVHHGDDDYALWDEPWDLVICCYGKLEPVGSFWEATPKEWDAAVFANALLPLREVRALYPLRRAGASVCFFSGSGSSGPAPSFSAYSASKVMLIKATELLDDESPDCKFFVLGPGIVRTKMLDQVTRAGERAANQERVRSFLASGDPGTSHDDIYACLMACAAASKAAVGGRNVYVPGDDWRRLEELADRPDMFKLRREGDDALRR